MEEVEMPKRVLTAVLFIALAAPFVGAQVLGRGKVVPRQKPRLATAVTVIDLRNLADEKKPPKRAPDAFFSPRMRSISSPRASTAALSPMQLSEALQSAGISVVPPNVYARFTPGQSSAHVKGYMYLESPAWVYPDHAEFNLTVEHAPSHENSNGPLVVLREPGTFSFDFLVEFPNAPTGAHVTCCVMSGTSCRQVKLLRAENGVQHVIVIRTLDQAAMDLEDEQRSVGIYCFIEASGPTPLTWLLYLVDITKL